MSSHPYSYPLSTIQKHTTHLTTPLKQNCCLFLPICPPDDQSPLHLMHPWQNLLLILCQTYRHMEECAQFWSCCMWYGRWYRGRCMTPLPNSTTYSASKLSSFPSPEFPVPIPGASCSIMDTSLRWDIAGGGGNKWMIQPCQHRNLAPFMSWWFVLIVSLNRRVYVHTMYRIFEGRD